MPVILAREDLRKTRHRRVRKRVFGMSGQPRLCVFRSNKHLYAQVIDDLQGKTLFAFSTTAKKFRTQCSKGGTVEAAQKLGQVFAPEMLKKGIRKIVFDRGGYQYHGRVEALAESLRDAGVEF